MVFVVTIPTLPEWNRLVKTRRAISFACFIKPAMVRFSAELIKVCSSTIRQLTTWRPVGSLSRNAIYSHRGRRERITCWWARPAVSMRVSAPRPAAPSETENFNRLETGSGEIDAPGNVRAIASFQGSTYIASYGRGVAAN